MQSSEPKSHLIHLVELLSNFVSQVQLKKALSPYYLSILSELLGEFNEVLPEIEFYEKHDLFKALQKDLRHIVQNHKEIKSFHIDINLAPPPTQAALLKYNFFPEKVDIDYTPGNFS